MRDQVSQKEFVKWSREIPALFSDRRLLCGSLPWVLAIFSALNILVFYWPGGMAKRGGKTSLSPI